MDLRKFTIEHIGSIVICWVVVSAVFLLLFSVFGRKPIPTEPEDQVIESVDSVTSESDRSSGWQSVRNEFVRKHPRCEACGSRWELNVHHVVPFKDRPDLELEPSNLVTLCRKHHFRIGHDPDGPWKPEKPSWLLSNPRVREDAKRWRK